MISLISRSLMAMLLGEPLIYIFQLLRLARASSDVLDLNCYNKALIAKHPTHGYRYHKRHKAIDGKIKFQLEKCLQQDKSKPEFCDE